MMIPIALPFVAVGVTILVILAYMVRNVYFHPLSRFPGPKIWASCQIPALSRTLQGLLWRDLLELHRKHGEVVRVSPNQLSIISPSAWQDIYGHRRAGQQGRFVRDNKFYTPSLNGSNNILNSNGADHSRFRRVLNHAFSERVLKDQEPLIEGYIKVLVERLKERAVPLTTVGQTKPTDFAKFYNWTTFDIIGDLTYSESFDMLQKSTYHPWVSFVYLASKFQVLFTAARRIEEPFQTIFSYFIPNKLSGKALDNYNITKGRVQARLEKDSHRPDFMSYILRHSEGENGLSFNEMVANMTILMLAGSETSSSLLSGATYLLLKNPSKLERLVREIRGAFPYEQAIKNESMPNLPYLNAVIRESMRVYPPTPGGLFRVAPAGGQHVGTHFIPEGTSVFVPFLASNHYPPYWASTEEFIPERWLDEDERFAFDQKDTVQPFSVGPQDCIGKSLANMEIRLILCYVLWNFDLELCPESAKWMDDQKIFTFWEKPPLMVTIKERT